MNDMSSVIEPKSDQLNADDLIAGPMTVTIKEVRISPGSEQPVSIVIDGTDKFYRPCKSMSRVLVQGWGADAKQYAGRSLTLYRDPKVKWGGLEVGGIRISHMSDLDGEKLMMLTATRGQRKPHKVLPLAKPTKPAASDFSDELAQLKASAKPGHMDALKAAWEAIGKDARKALAAELPPLQVICNQAVDEEPDPFGLPPTDENPAAAKLASIKSALDQAADGAAVEAAVAEYQTHSDALSDEQKMKVETAISKARARFEEKVA